MIDEREGLVQSEYRVLTERVRNSNEGSLKGRVLDRRSTSCDSDDACCFQVRSRNSVCGGRCTGALQFELPGARGSREGDGRGKRRRDMEGGGADLYDGALYGVEPADGSGDVRQLNEGFGSWVRLRLRAPQRRIKRTHENLVTASADVPNQFKRMSASPMTHPLMAPSDCFLSLGTCRPVSMSSMILPDAPSENVPRVEAVVRTFLPRH